MLLYILKRLFFESIPTLFVIITITFFMIRSAPGGPFSSEKAIAPEALEQLNTYYNLDKPLLIQYKLYLINLCKGDLGPSFKHINRSVNELIATSLPVSLELGFYALLFALLIGCTAGIIAAIKPNTLFDYLSMGFSMAGICIPAFVMGPILVLVFAVTARIFNVSGWDSPLDRVLPSLTLGMAYLAYIARLTRSGMIDVLKQDFITAARAKGLPEHIIILKHALPGGLQPVISFLGPAIAGLITGSFVVETIFSIPGLGRFFVTAAFNRDYTLIMGTVLLYATLIIVLNTLVDIIQAWIDPRIRQKL